MEKELIFPLMYINRMEYFPDEKIIYLPMRSTNGIKKSTYVPLEKPFRLISKVIS